MELAESAQEAARIVDALNVLRAALRDAGFAPR